jgi:predicted aspartyl protease
MGTDTIGRVTVRAMIENSGDLYMAEKGALAADQVRRIEVDDALVDTGATNLSMPKKLIQQLGLIPFRSRVTRTSAGTTTFQVYGGVRLTVQGRDCHLDVVELPDDCPVLIGQIPLESLDFVVDMSAHRLIGNPAHGGEHMIELY